MVHRFRTFIKNSTTTNADIDRRNKNYRDYKAAKEQAEKLHVTTEATAVARDKADALRRRNLVPIVVTKLTKEYHEIMPEIILREYFTDLVSKSLIWDAEDVAENMNGIRYMAHKYIASIGGMRALKEAAIRNKSAYLNRVYDVCMEAGKKIAKKKSAALKAKTNPDNVMGQRINFMIETGDEKEAHKKIDELDNDTLSDMVKDKVLQVVKDENEAQKKDDDFVQDLKTSVNTLAGDSETETIKGTDQNGDSASSDGADYGSESGGSESGSADGTTGTAANAAGEGTTESFIRYARGGKIDIQRSLFRSMLARSYSTAAKRKMIKENASQIVAVNNNEEEDDPVEKTLRDQPNSLNIYDIYLNDGGEDLSYIDFVKNSDEIAIAGDDAQIDNDEILAEALGMYTILECASTIKLISPKFMDIKKAIVRNYKN